MLHLLEVGGVQEEDGFEPEELLLEEGREEFGIEKDLDFLV
jgi:hypothetical protein